MLKLFWENYDLEWFHIDCFVGWSHVCVSIVSVQVYLQELGYLEMTLYSSVTFILLQKIPKHVEVARIE